MTDLTEADVQWTAGYRAAVLPFPPNAYAVTGMWLDARHDTHRHTATVMVAGRDEAVLLAMGKVRVLAYANDPANAGTSDP